MNNAKIAFALAPVVLLAAGVSAYLARPAPAAVARDGSASTVKVISRPGRAVQPVSPANPGNPANPANTATPGNLAAQPPGLARLVGPAHPVNPAKRVYSVEPANAAHPRKPAKPVAVRSSGPGTSGSFTDWLNRTGAALLKSDVGILYQTRSDAAAHNAAALKADAGALIATGDAALGDPPPAHAASWDAAFAAQIQAGDYLEAGNRAAAVAESGIVKGDLYAFYAQAANST